VLVFGRDPDRFVVFLRCVDGGLGDKILQVMWTGVKYAVTDNLDVIAAY
jgi:hypothetical protein